MVEPIPSLVGSRGGGRAEPSSWVPMRSVVQSCRGVVRWGRPCDSGHRRGHGGALEHRGMGREGGKPPINSAPSPSSGRRRRRPQPLPLPLPPPLLLLAFLPPALRPPAHYCGCYPVRWATATGINVGSDNATAAAAAEPAEEPEAVARSDYSSAAVSALGRRRRGRRGRRSVSGDGRTSAVGPLLATDAADAEAAPACSATASATLATPHYYFFHGPSLSVPLSQLY